MKKAGIKWSILSQDSVKTTPVTALLAVWLWTLLQKKSEREIREMEDEKAYKQTWELRIYRGQFQGLISHFR